jgi:hypothetical protein
LVVEPALGGGLAFRLATFPLGGGLVAAFGGEALEADLGGGDLNLRGGGALVELAGAATQIPLLQNPGADFVVALALVRQGDVVGLASVQLIYTTGLGGAATQTPLLQNPGVDLVVALALVRQGEVVLLASVQLVYITGGGDLARVLGGGDLASGLGGAAASPKAKRMAMSKMDARKEVADMLR